VSGVCMFLPCRRAARAPSFLYYYYYYSTTCSVLTPQKGLFRRSSIGAKVQREADPCGRGDLLGPAREHHKARV
jgi:hypothetical protein